MSKVIFQGIIEGVATRKDKTLRVSIGTQELDGQEMAALMSLHQSFVSVLMRPDNITKDNIRELDEVEVDLYDEKKAKTPSQRLRAVLYVNWEQKGKQGDFKDYYAKQMDVLIEHFKSKLA